VSSGSCSVVDQIIAIVLLIVVEGETDSVEQEMGEIAFGAVHSIPPLAVQIFGDGDTSEIRIEGVPFETLGTLVGGFVSVAAGDGVGEETEILVLEQIRVEVAGSAFLGGQWGISRAVFDGRVFEALVVR